MELTFCELRAKEVVNIYDGKCLGNVIDIVFDTSCARILGIVVPKDRNIFNIFKCNSDLFIPYNKICKIGKDIILVELCSSIQTSSVKSQEINNEKIIENDLKNHNKQQSTTQYDYYNKLSQ